MIRTCTERRVLAVAAMLLVLPIASCQTEQPLPAPSAMAPQPPSNDPALEYRDWQPSYARYTNDTVLVWPDYAPLRSEPMDPIMAAIVEPTLAMTNAIGFPTAIAQELPNQMVANKSVWIGPTYTAMPAMPPRAPRDVGPAGQPANTFPTRAVYLKPTQAAEGVPTSRPWSVILTQPAAPAPPPPGNSD